MGLYTVRLSRRNKFRRAARKYRRRRRRNKRRLRVRRF